MCIELCVLSVLTECVSVHHMHACQRALGPLELELQVVVNHCVNAGI